MQLLLACGNNAVSQLGVSNSRNVDVFYRACDGDRVKVLYTCPVQAVGNYAFITIKKMNHW